MYLPDEEFLSQLSDTKDSSDGFPEQRLAKGSSRQTPQVTHTLQHSSALHTSCLTVQNDNIQDEQSADFRTAWLNVERFAAAGEPNWSKGDIGYVQLFLVCLPFRALWASIRGRVFTTSTTLSSTRWWQK